MTKPDEKRAAWLRGVIEAATAELAGKPTQFRAYGRVGWITDTPETRGSFLKDHEHRAKPQPLHRPFTAAEAVEFCPRFVVRVSDDNDACWCAGVRRGGNVLMIRKSDQCHFELTLLELFQHWTTDDGAPCGVMEDA